MVNQTQIAIEVGSGAFFTYPNGSISKHRVTAGKIASNFTCELVSIRRALDLAWTNITHSNDIIVVSDCRKTRFT